MSLSKNEKALFKKLCNDICIPLPSKLPEITPDATSAEICDEIDRYFTDIIQVYPEDIQKTLMLYYFGNEELSVSWTEPTDLASLSNQYAAQESSARVFEIEAGIGFSEKDEIVFFATSYLQTCPILFRAIKVHEIACHLGQILDGNSKYGSGDWLYCQSTGERIRISNDFLEICAAIAEKPLYESIPSAAVEQELQSVSDERFAKSLLQSHKQAKKMEFASYMILQHRIEKVSQFELVSMLTTDAFTRYDQKLFEQKHGISIEHLRTHAANLILSAGALVGAISCAMHGDLSMAPVLAAIGGNGYINAAKTTLAWRKIPKRVPAP